MGILSGRSTVTLEWMVRPCYKIGGSWLMSSRQILIYLHLYCLHVLVDLESTSLLQIQLFSTTMIGILRWIARQQIELIELDKRRKCMFTVLSPRTPLRKES